MGPFVVLVRQPQVFIERFIVAVKRNCLGLQCGLVNYFDPATFSGSAERPAFIKKREFDWQREYSFALDRKTSAAEPYTFDIGSLADLCTLVDASRLNEPLKVTLPE
jgi:hypothetical protein